MRAVVKRSSETVRGEHDGVPLAPSFGAVPRALDGVLFRNGPGRMERGGTAYGHLFDGDGHIVRLSFEDGTVRYTNRFVRTRYFEREEAAGAMLYRGFGTNLPGGLRRNLMRLDFKNAANTNVIAHAGRLLTLWEGGLPHALDPQTLRTEGLFDFEGGLKNRFSLVERLLSPDLPFSAHPRVDAETGEMFNFGVSYGLENRLLTYRVDPSGVLVERRVHTLPRLSFVHDFALTRRFLVFLMPWADFDVPRALLGLTTPAASLKLSTDAPMEVLLVPRDGGPTRRFSAGPGFVFHIGQGYEREDGRIVIDAVRFLDYPPLEDLDALYAGDNPGFIPRLHRIIVDPERGTSTTERLSDCGAELPRVAPGRGARRYVFTTGQPPSRGVPFFSSLQRIDTDTGATVSRDLYPDLPGEPVVVGDGSDDEHGFVLSLVYRAQSHRTELLVARTEDLEPVAVVPLPHHVPPGFHGNWVARDELAGAGGGSRSTSTLRPRSS
ncbi:MAG: carotenoid oxygenase family protein [Myxococcota bacterium]